MILATVPAVFRAMRIAISESACRDNGFDDMNSDCAAYLCLQNYSRSPAGMKSLMSRLHTELFAPDIPTTNNNRMDTNVGALITRIGFWAS